MTAQPWKYNHVIVERVIDGDTVSLVIDMGFHSLYTDHFRLIGIDTPELKGSTIAAGKAAKAYLEELLPVGAFVTLDSYKTDKFGRWLAAVFLPDGRNVSTLMRESGHAVVWPHK